MTGEDLSHDRRKGAKPATEKAYIINILLHDREKLQQIFLLKE
jgi:hypothetical protein